MTEHALVARICPVCQRRRLPKEALQGVVLGQQRLGVNLVSLMVTLREEGRLPIRIIQWYLETVHQLHLSVGAIVQAVHGVARQAETAVRGCSSKSAPVPWCRATKPAGARTGARLCLDLQHSQRTILPASGSG